MAVHRVTTAGLAALILVSSPAAAWSCEVAKIIHATSVQQVSAFFEKQRKNVVTFMGYSGAEYEDKAGMLARAAGVLGALDPKQTIVNIGATLEGIGAVYELAKQKGFETTGIVSTQARDTKATLSPCVDTVFFVEDTTWGGLIEGTTRLSPTSLAMVAASDRLVAIGGGEVSRDELQAAIRLGKQTQIFPADMNHAIALERAAKKGQPAPTDFRGAVGAAFAGRSSGRRPDA